MFSVHSDMNWGNISNFCGICIRERTYSKLGKGKICYSSFLLWSQVIIWKLWSSSTDMIITYYSREMINILIALCKTTNKLNHANVSCHIVSWIFNKFPYYIYISYHTHAVLSICILHFIAFNICHSNCGRGSTN